MKFNNILYIIFSSVLLSVFFVPAVYLASIISWKTDFLEFAYLVFAAVLYGVTLISKSKRGFLYKWLLSLPLSYLCFQYFWRTNYALRSLNWVFPGYGEQSAGGGFAVAVLMVSFGFFCLVSMLIALFVKIPKFELFKKIQVCLCGIFGAVTVIVVVLLEQSFPAYP